MSFLKKLNNISIVYKLSGIITFLVIGSMIFVGLFTYSNNKRAILDRTYDQLTSVRFEKTQRLEGFLRNKIIELDQFGNTSAISEIFQCFPDYNILDNPVSMDDFNSFIGDFLVKQGEVSRFVLYYRNELFAIEPHNKPKKLNIIGFDELTTYFCRSEFPKDTIITDLIFNEKNDLVFYIFSSLNCSKDSVFIGFEISVEQINKIMWEDNPYNGLGNSGEVYLVGKDKLMRSQSRFVEKSVMKISVPNFLLNSILPNISGTNIIRDYRDVVVLSSYGTIRWGSEYWMVFAEIDYEEAMVSVYAFRDSIVFLGLLGAILFSAVIMLLIYTITRPVSNLKSASVEISKANYSVRVPVGNKDEIGQLSESFNMMAQKIEEQNKHLEEEKKNRLQSMLDWQEQERRRLSRELHDGVGQLLLSAKFRLGRIKGRSINDDEIVEETSIILQQTVQDIKDISNDLMPSVLLEFGLSKGVEDLIAVITKTNAIEIQYEISLLSEPPERTSTYIYRIVQELFSNIIKHSKATNSEIYLHENQDNFVLKLSDDGCGFDTNMEINAKAHGLRNIKERVILLNGRCSFVSSIGHGTQIEILIPKN